MITSTSIEKPVLVHTTTESSVTPKYHSLELYEMERLVEAIEQELGRSLRPLVRQAFLQVPRN